jgi:phosphoribosylformylglycinamidine synthase
MMANAIDEAVRNAVAVGGDPEHMAGLDNFCWCDPVASPKNPDGEYKLAQLVRACRALAEVCTAYGVPCISGKDSMKNDFQWGDTRISIPPTVLYTVIAKIADASLAVTMDAKNAGDLVYVLGTTRDELGGSEFARLKGGIGGSVPRVDAAANAKLYRALYAAIRDGLVASAHDCSDGGLATCLAESAFAGDLGMMIDLAAVPFAGEGKTDAAVLFAESAGRFVVTVRPQHAIRFESALAGCAFARVGAVSAEKRLTVTGIAGAVVIDAGTDDLKAAWRATLDF